MYQGYAWDKVWAVEIIINSPRMRSSLFLIDTIHSFLGPLATFMIVPLLFLLSFCCITFPFCGIWNRVGLITLTPPAVYNRR